MAKKADEDQAMEKIRDYMLGQNRPYSAIDVTTNLRKEFGKTLVVKCLDALVISGELSEKVIGKQKIYFANQATMPALDPEELAALEADIATTNAAVAELQEALKVAESELAEVSSSLTTDELRSRQAALEIELEVGELEASVGAARASAADFDPAERRRAQGHRDAAAGEWRKRKRLASEILDAILESYPKKKRDLYEEVGIETDEESKAVMPK